MKLQNEHGLEFDTYINDIEAKQLKEAYTKE